MRKIISVFLALSCFASSLFIPLVFATKDGAGSQELHKRRTHPNKVGHALAGATIANFLQKVYEDEEAPIPNEY